MYAHLLLAYANEILSQHDFYFLNGSHFSFSLQLPLMSLCFDHRTRDYTPREIVHSAYSVSHSRTDWHAQPQAQG